MTDLGLVMALGCCCGWRWGCSEGGSCVGSDEVVVVFGMVVSFLGRPWRRGAVLMRFSVNGLWGAGAGGAEMILLSMVSKCVESVWRPGSMLMDGLRALM